MKKFIYKSFLITFPFFIIYAVYLKREEYHTFNDLNRIGGLNFDYDFFSRYPDLSLKKINFEYFGSETKKKYKILNIGDSFSRQGMKGSNGYVNILSKNSNLINMPFSNDPFERLEHMLNNSFFDSVNVDYVIIECVQRNFLSKFNKNPLGKIKSINELREDDIIKKNKLLKTYSSINELDPFFSNTSLKFFIRNYLNIKREKEKVHISTTTKPLFSYKRNQLVYYYKDVTNIKQNNNIDEIKKANNKLNSISKELSNKNIKLIVLIPPNKYDFYYDYLINPIYPRVDFYEILDSLEKNYIYFNPKEILNTNKKLKKDLYFFDDTHWSPIASQIISNKIYSLINK